MPCLRSVPAVSLAILSICLLLGSGSAFGQDYRALEGVESLKAVFDFRYDNPDNVLFHLTLVHRTYNDAQVRSTDGKPDFAVVFMDSSVTLLTSNRQGFTDGEKKTLAQMDEMISVLAQEGVKLEVCQVATDFFELDSESIGPEIEQVPNGWISSIGYQARGYSLVPVY